MKCSLRFYILFFSVMGMLAKGWEVSALEIGRLLCDQKEPFAIVGPHSNLLILPDFSDNGITTSFEAPQNRLPALVTLPLLNFPSIFSCHPIVEKILIHLIGSSDDPYKKQPGEDIYNFLTVNRRLSNEKEYWQAAFRVGFNSVLAPLGSTDKPIVYENKCLLTREYTKESSVLKREIPIAFYISEESKITEKMNLDLSAESLRTLFARLHERRLMQYNVIKKYLKYPRYTEISEHILFMKELIPSLLKNNITVFNIDDLFAIKTTVKNTYSSPPEELISNNLLKKVNERLEYLINRGGELVHFSTEELEKCHRFLIESPEDCVFLIDPFMHQYKTIINKRSKPQEENFFKNNPELAPIEAKSKKILKEFSPYTNVAQNVDSVNKLMKLRKEIPPRAYGILLNNDVLKKYIDLMENFSLENSRISTEENPLKKKIALLLKNEKKTQKFCDLLKKENLPTVQDIEELAQSIPSDIEAKSKSFTSRKKRKNEDLYPFSLTSFLNTEERERRLSSSVPIKPESQLQDSRFQQRFIKSEPKY